MTLIILAMAASLLVNPMPSIGPSARSVGVETQQTTPQRDADSSSAAEPKPDVSGTSHAGQQGVSLPSVTYSQQPEFADEARRKKLNGTCVVSLVVNAQGIPRHVHVVHSIASDVAPELRSAALGLDAKAVDAVKQYRFRPATYRGKPVSAKINIEVAFRLY
jgi:TonB family protein